MWIGVLIVCAILLVCYYSHGGTTRTVALVGAATMAVMFAYKFDFACGEDIPRDMAARVGAQEDAVIPQYPYVYRYRSTDDVDKAFQKIAKYQLGVISVNYKIKNMPDLKPADFVFRQPDLFGLDKPGPVIIECKASDYEEMTWISDFFNHKARMKCRRYDEPMSPAEYWQENWEEIQAAHPTLEAQADAVYDKVRGCGNFRGYLVVGIAKRIAQRSGLSLKNMRILDFSGGWGDRGIAMQALGAYGVVVDPNPDVHEGYDAARDYFARTKGKPDPAKASKYVTIMSPFQTAELPQTMDGPVLYDLVITSPPYFDLEDYGDAAGQSIREFSELDAWFEGFLMTSMMKAWGVLKTGGYMIIIINDVRGKHEYVERMVHEFTERSGGNYLGPVSYAEVTRGKQQLGKKNAAVIIRSPQPMWIWQK